MHRVGRVAKGLGVQNLPMTVRREAPFKWLKIVKMPVLSAV